MRAAGSGRAVERIVYAGEARIRVSAVFRGAEAVEHAFITGGGRLENRSAPMDVAVSHTA